MENSWLKERTNGLGIALMLAGLASVIFSYFFSPKISPDSNESDYASITAKVDSVRIEEITEHKSRYAELAIYFKSYGRFYYRKPDLDEEIRNYYSKIKKGNPLTIYYLSDHRIISMRNDHYNFLSFDKSKREYSDRIMMGRLIGIVMLLLGALLYYLTREKKTTEP